MPLFHLDHINFDPALTVDRVVLHRSRTALVASDHLPLVADFRVDDPGANGQAHHTVENDWDDMLDMDHLKLPV